MLAVQRVKAEFYRVLLQFHCFFEHLFLGLNYFSNCFFFERVVFNFICYLHFSEQQYQLACEFRVFSECSSDQAFHLAFQQLQRVAADYDVHEFFFNFRFLLWICCLEQHQQFFCFNDNTIMQGSLANILLDLLQIIYVLLVLVHQLGQMRRFKVFLKRT
ncbi:Hypothetical_protein [Hexamita inflata]|uniref:Hypothetical_protein n=1 Tax=Hexamita inflata TaxID=28002 RepID=A0AA86UMG9_9EUKA|nr:Hypothetical protein HINF_LOCUS44807 [Hexamita inflata]